MIKRIYEKVFTEVPYVDYSDNTKVFDLQFEEFKSNQGILIFIKNILNGDKYLNTIQLNTKEEKQDFIKNLKENTVFNTIVTYKFSIDQKKQMEKLLNV